MTNAIPPICPGWRSILSCDVPFACFRGNNSESTGADYLKLGLTVYPLHPFRDFDICVIFTPLLNGCLEARAITSMQGTINLGYMSIKHAPRYPPACDILTCPSATVPTFDFITEYKKMARSARNTPSCHSCPESGNILQYF